ncbi:hypothetical protein ACFE04_031894 [Oxalis oulophora]
MELIPGLNDDMANECLIRVPFNSFPLIASTCNHWKARICSPEFFRRRKAANLSQHVFVMTQARVNPIVTSKCSPMPVYRLTFYEPDKSAWCEFPAIPGFLEGGLPLFCQVVGLGSGLVLLGGWDPKTFEVSTAVYIYDFVNATWQRGADMPGVRRSLFGCTSDCDSRVYVAGGHDEDKNALRSVLMYDVVSNSWTRLDDLARERDECKAVFQHGKVHVISGYNTDRQGRFENTAETFDLATWEWSPVNEDFMGSTGPLSVGAYVAASDGELYTCLGSNLVMREDDTWKVIAELPTDLRNTTRMMTWGKNMWVIGSEKLGGSHVSYVFDLKSYKWTKRAVPEEYSGHVHSGCHVEL